MKTTLYLLAPVGDGQPEPTDLARRQVGVLCMFLTARCFDACYSTADAASQWTATKVCELQKLRVRTIDITADWPGDVFASHHDKTVLVVCALETLREYFGRLLDAARLEFSPGGISVVVHSEEDDLVHTLNSTFHLQGV